MSETIIKASNLEKDYKMTKDNVVRALRGIDLDIRKGEIVTIMGPSGSGKSTLLNLLGSLDRPTRGEVEIDGVRLSGAKRKNLHAIRSSKIGFVFQQYNLIPTLSALENVMLPLRYAKVRPKEIKKKALAALALVGLGKWSHHKPHELSGGQQQRVAIARALVNNPAVILADEPTGNLDTKTGRDVIAMMRGLNKRLGITFVIVTHNPEIANGSDRTIRLVDGKIEKGEE